MPWDNGVPMPPMPTPPPAYGNSGFDPNQPPAVQFEQAQRPPMPPMPPDAMSGNIPMPPANEQEIARQQAYSALVAEEKMKPWEAEPEPEWLKDTEPTPLDTIQKQIGW